MGVRFFRAAVRPVFSYVLEAPGAELLGARFGAPWTDERQWTAADAGRALLEPDALRLAWKVHGQPMRVGVALEVAAAHDRHGPFFFEYRRPRGTRDFASVERRPMRSYQLGVRSPPPTLAEVVGALCNWRAASEADRVAERWNDPEARPDPDRRAGETASEAKERREELARARALFGLSEDFTRKDLQRAHRKLALEHHPDRGGDRKHMAAINAARDRLNSDLDARNAKGNQ